MTELPWGSAGATKAGTDREGKASAQYRGAGTGAVVIEGLQNDVQGWYDRWYTNHGWVIESLEPGAAFYGSESPFGRPQLEITFTDAPTTQNSADISVVYIERTPEFKRYDPQNAYTYKSVRGQEIGIMDRPGNVMAQMWPPNGTMVQYRAHVKNVGATAPVQGFTFAWTVNGKTINSGKYSSSLAPGEETTIEIPNLWQNEHSDHRARTVSLLVDTDTPETTKNNNYLSIYSHGLNLGLWVEQSFYDRYKAKRNGLGSYSFEDWAQWQFNIWNEVYLAKSKFALAPDGCLERVRIQKITIVPDGTLDPGGNHVPGGTTNYNYDGEWGCAWSKDNPTETERYIDDIMTQVEAGLIHECSHQIGLIDIYQMNVDASLPSGDKGKVRLKAGRSSVLSRGCIDPFGGLMGGGDTRNDTMMPSFIIPPNEPSLDPMMQFPLFESTGLYSSLDVGALNSNLGHRRGFYGEFLYDLPRMNFLRVLDGSGNPMPGAIISVYQSNGGEFKDEAPVSEGVADSQGLFRLPDQETGQDRDFTTMTRHTLRPNPFGRVDVVGGNGVFLIRAKFQGQEEWQFLKIWELVTGRYRGNDPVLTRDLRFNISPSAIDPANLAAGKTVTPPEVAGLVDGDVKVMLSLPSDRGRAVTIDLGAEVNVAEIELHTYNNNGDMWKQFELQAYVQELPGGLGMTFAREADWGWAVGNKRDVDASDFRHMVVTYRGTPKKARYVRIVNLEGGGGQLSEIVVRAAK